jgi:sugar-specific transcriptional regulator TrmB
MISKKALLIAVGFSFVTSSSFAYEVSLESLRRSNEAKVQKFEALKKEDTAIFAKEEAKSKEAQDVLMKNIEKTQKDLASQNREFEWYKGRIDATLKNMEMAKKSRQRTLNTSQKNLEKKIVRHNELLGNIRNNLGNLRASNPTA